MPQIIYKSTEGKPGGQIVYDYRDWLAGVDFAGDAQNNGIIAESLDRSVKADPLRYAGYISPGKRAVDVTNSNIITNFIRTGLMYSQAGYFVSNGPLLHKGTSLFSSPALVNAGNWPHTIDHAHTGETGDDGCLYYDGTPDLCWFYSFNDDTDWDVGIYNFRTDTFNDDFMSTVPTTPLGGSYITGGKGYPHPLIVADDDVLYMGDRNFVHAYDWNTKVFTAAVLTLPKGYTITAFAKTNDRRLAIAAYYNIASASSAPELYEGKSFVWVWNLLDLDPDFAYNLHDNYVSEILNWNGEIIAFTAGFGTLGANAPYKLQVLRGGRFEVLTAWTNGYPIRGGVDLNQDEIYWITQGTLNSYTKNPYTNRYIYNYLSGGSAGVLSGMCRVLTGSTTPIFFVSTSDSSSGGLSTLNENYATQTLVWPKTTYPACPPRQKCRLKKMTINYKNTATGGISLKIQTELDKTDLRTTLDFISEVTDLKKAIYDYDVDGNPLGDYTSIRPKMLWQGTSSFNDAPVIESLIYDFEYVNI